VNNKHIKAGISQMEFEVVDNGVIKLPCSTPARYNFVGHAVYAPEAFESAVNDEGFTVISSDMEFHDTGEFYYSADLLTDHYKKVKIRVWEHSANIYPRNELPDKYEFTRILKAIETAFGDLEHMAPRGDGGDER